MRGKIGSQVPEACLKQWQDACGKTTHGSTFRRKARRPRPVPIFRSKPLRVLTQVKFPGSRTVEMIANPHTPLGFSGGIGTETGRYPDDASGSGGWQMKLTRREFIKASVAFASAMAAGCATTGDEIPVTSAMALRKAKAAGPAKGEWWPPPARAARNGARSRSTCRTDARPAFAATRSASPITATSARAAT